MDAKTVGAVAAGYTRDDRVQIKADGDALLQALADAKRDDVEPGLAQFLHDIVVESLNA